MSRLVHAVIVREDGAEESLGRLEVADIARSQLVDGSGLLDLRYDYGPALLPDGSWRGEGMWRYRRLLPIGDEPIRFPLSVGGTPLIAPPGLRDALGMPHLWLKDETRGPSCSNKDRATALVIQHALVVGARFVSCASTGNVAVSLAIGAAAAGLQAVTFVAADVSDAKIGLMLEAGATVVRVRGGYDAAFALSRAAAGAFSWIDRNTGINPLTIDAKKTVAFEIWEQLDRKIPDAVVVPVGDGPTLNGMAKGFRELVACGAVDRVPRLIGVQAEGCQPIRRSWETGQSIRPTIGRTIADGIAVSRPIAGAAAVRAVVSTDGAFVAVSDEQMLDAMRLLATRAGVLAEPAAAASLAGLRVAIEEGRVAPRETVVALITGSSLKTPQFLKPSGRVIESEPSLDALRQWFD